MSRSRAAMEHQAAEQKWKVESDVEAGPVHRFRPRDQKNIHISR